eukprot:TRINITY_DN7087_c0_g1_i1.p1 TRINITY_DN7087_c0_g1~~TRINITY_DN7087_c0_g1_i1.p1  ORF type:complete len:421 (+),score=96.43 TRINITY_DN7087_c0_g1_i1:72-1265(+)
MVVTRSQKKRKAELPKDDIPTKKGKFENKKAGSRRRKLIKRKEETFPSLADVIDTETPTKAVDTRVKKIEKEKKEQVEEGIITKFFRDCDNYKRQIKLHGVTDIDTKYADVMLEDADLARNVFQFYFEKEDEQQATIDPNYIKRNPDLVTFMRFLLMDWLNEVAEEFELRTNVWNAAVKLVDRYLSASRNIRHQELQLIGCACLFIAAKFHTCTHPVAESFCEVVNYAFTKDQLLKMEMKICIALDFHIYDVTALNFVKRFFMVFDSPPQEAMLTYYFWECALSQYCMIGFKPSMLAASCIVLANLCLSKDQRVVWSKDREFYTGYKLEELGSCVRGVYASVTALRKRTKAGNHTAVELKFSHPDNLQVAFHPLCHPNVMSAVFPKKTCKQYNFYTE